MNEENLEKKIIWAKVVSRKTSEKSSQWGWTSGWSIVFIVRNLPIHLIHYEESTLHRHNTLKESLSYKENALCLTSLICPRYPKYYKQIPKDLPIKLQLKYWPEEYSTCYAWKSNFISIDS